MDCKKLSLSLLVASLSSVIFMNSAFAVDEKLMRVSVLDASTTDEAVAEEVVTEEDAEPVKMKAQENCEFTEPKERFFNGQVVAVRKKLLVEEGEIFRVKVFLKNTGNMPWFSSESTCSGPQMALGTDRERDRDSELYAAELDDVENTNWEAANRIGMDQLRVDPGQIASFTFWSQAPEHTDVIKEYFKPVITAIAWIESAPIDFELMVGEPAESSSDMRLRMAYANESGSVMDVPLTGKKMVHVDLSEQRLELRLDDYVVREFMISSGKPSTPTPVGETTIQLKQDVRIGGEAPHYIMPKFMWFRAGGYGFHALPSLGKRDSGVFWTEAMNHIGIPVSHGCVRLLPEDANFMFDFVEIGTRVLIER